MQIIDNWKTREDGVVIHITNPEPQLTHRLRQDQTGKIFMNAHDVEGSPFTYTEVVEVPNPDRAVDWTSANKPYALGAIVGVNGRVMISTMDDNNYTPTLDGGYAWEEYYPLNPIVEREPEYTDWVPPEPEEGETT